jgi:hypothetical protein
MEVKKIISNGSNVNQRFREEAINMVLNGCPTDSRKCLSIKYYNPSI